MKDSEKQILNFRWLGPSSQKLISLSLFLILLMVTASCVLSSPSTGTPVPTPQCVEPTLILGGQQFRIEPVQREPNSFPEIPRRSGDIAYWVEDTTVKYIFALSPTKDNLALNTVLKAGDSAVINWADCSQDEYTVQSMDTSPAWDLNVFDQSGGGLTIYVQTDTSTLVIRGERSIAQPAETSAPAPTPEFQVDIRLLNPPPADDQTVKIAIEVTNRGSQMITLDKKDISLRMENTEEVQPSTVEPALPQELKPGFPLTIFATFPKPGSNSAVLQIFDVTFDYYFQ